MKRMPALSLGPVLFLFILPVFSVQSAWAQATLENPQPGSFQSGVGVISGWACDAQTIEVSFDGGPRLKAGVGTIREDTRGVCGDTDNGFGLLYNWNLLGDGPHTVTAYADGVEFARVTVTVTTLGEEFRRGLSREVTIPNFPATGTNVVLRWQEAQQNFVITQTTSTPVSAHFLPDANLRGVVAQALGKSPGATITKAELATLRELTAWGSSIVDLTGLEFATNLTQLNLLSNAITDLSPLAGLTNLAGLHLDYNAITDLSPLAGLTNLTWLGLDYNAITDLSPLAGLTNLAWLYLDSTLITDLSPLAGLTNLEILLIGRTFVKDMSPLFGLPKLNSLYINGPVRQEDIDILTARGVAVHGSLWVIPAIGDIEIHHDNVIVMHLSELPITGAEIDIAYYARSIYEEFEDAFDYLMFVFNLNEAPEGFPYGFYSSVRNDTQGTGRNIRYDNRYGSEDHLRGVLYFPYRSAIRFGPSLHELMHTWANDVIPTSRSSHWGFSSAEGQLGGFSLRNLVHLGGDRYTAGDFGSFANEGNSVPYSPIELYLAGLIPPGEVPDLWVAEDGEWLIENGEPVRSDDGWPIFTATKVRTITIEDIIAEHGKRVPDWTTSQKDFRAAAVLLIDDDHPATPAHIQTVSDHVSGFSHPGNDGWFLYNFYEATGGRATITMDGLSELRLPD